MPSQTERQSAAAKAADLALPKLLAGQIAVVTGADSGIGQAVAIAFAKAGADVAIPVHEDRRGAEATLRQVEAAGQRGTLLPLDQRDARQVVDFFRKVREELGTPTLLVNNAGVDAIGKDVVEMSFQDMENEMRTNFMGPFYCAHEFLKALDEENKGGVVVNVTSVHQEYPRAGAAGYDCAKGALRNLTRTLALELGDRNVRVVNVAPGMVLTPFNQKAIDNPDVLEKKVKSIPMKRAAEPEEIARVVTFLASPWASYVHGTTVYVDGGLSMNQAQGA